MSAPFIGVLGNMLIVGGGCNFPEISAAEGGKKVFYNEVYAVDISGETNNIVWKVCPSLPQKAAYGVSVKTDKGIVWVGGQNESTSLSDVWLLEYDKTKGLSYTSLPSLPVKLVNGCGTSHNNIIYISGGVHDGTEKCNLYSLDLNNPSSAWNTTKTNYPYERQQAVLLFHNNELLLAGGYDEKEAIAFTDILRFDFQKGIWIKYSNITDNNDYTGTFIGATGFSYQEELLFVGGVNYKIFSEALLRIRKIQDAKEGGKSNLLSSLNKEAQEYMTHPAAWYKFRKHLQLYNPKTGKWKYSKAYESFARAGAGTVIWKDRLFVVCGETKPGIRTAEVNSFKLK
ncbi:MAG: cyclically-permuted mutarotase family protein [Bacteroidales bacterium]|nr:cyclically-permuted mutarotase family protein [Bacteroidales bacterium]